MAKIKPLRGFRFNPEKIRDLATVVTPPYDVIDTKAQNKFYEANPYNIIRLELGRKYADDNTDNNVYTRAAATFAKWYWDGILLKESKPALYVYQQEFQVYGKTRTRTGFICGVKAEDYAKGQILPHEETLPKHKADRLELMRATEANFSPIFGLYADPGKKIDRVLTTSVQGRKPDIEITDWIGEKHKVWVVTEEIVLNQVIEDMDGLKIFIADGHHRYETATAYAQEMKQKGQKNFDYMLITLVNLYDEGLVVLPTHRLVKNIAQFNFSRFLDRIKINFDLTPIPTRNDKQKALQDLLNKMAIAGKDGHAFGLYGGNAQLYLLTLKNDALIDQHTDSTKSLAWRHLDVTILHTLILEQILGIGAKERASEEFLQYTRDDLYSVEAVDRNICQFSLLMNPTKVQEVTNVAEAGEKMPQKSTFFYPKVITGLVINKLG